jgi:hypothetical protein
MTEEEIIERLENAFHTLKFIPETGKMQKVKSFWPEMKKEWINYGWQEARVPRYVPSPREISQMDEVLFSWLPLIDLADKNKTIRYRKILVMRSMGFPWKEISYSVAQYTKKKRISVRQCQIDFGA